MIQAVYKDEERQVKELMQLLASKKAELKSVKELKNEYNRAQ